MTSTVSIVSDNVNSAPSSLLRQLAQLGELLFPAKPEATLVELRAKRWQKKADKTRSQVGSRSYAAHLKDPHKQLYESWGVNKHAGYGKELGVANSRLASETPYWQSAVAY